MYDQIRVIGIPMDLGQALRGVDMGPSAVRYAGLAPRLRQMGYTVEDAGNVVVPVRDFIQHQAATAYLPAILQVCEAVYDAARCAMADGVLPVFIGGDHSISIGTVGGVSHGARTGVLWVDAHGDINTHVSSRSGNVHGMPLAALMGHGSAELVDLGRPGPKVREEDVVLVGIRDLDPPEKAFLNESDVTVYTMRAIDEQTMVRVAHEALDRLAGVDHLHVSLDLDSLDPRIAPGVGTPVPGGLSYREAHLLMEILADSGRVASVDVVEVNPILDVHNQTAEIAVQLVASLLGKSIL